MAVGGRSSSRGFARSSRLNKVLKEVLAEELERESDYDPRLDMITITEVAVDPDLRKAKVYLSRYDSDAEEALLELRTKLQRSVSRQMRMKRTPLLEFGIDPSLAVGERIEEILRRVANKQTHPESQGD